MIAPEQMAGAPAPAPPVQIGAANDDAVEAAAALAKSAHLVLSREDEIPEAGFAPQMINTGVMIIKRSAWSSAVFRRLSDAFFNESLCGVEQNQHRKANYLEQGCLVELLHRHLRRPEDGFLPPGVEKKVMLAPMHLWNGPWGGGRDPLGRGVCQYAEFSPRKTQPEYRRNFPSHHRRFVVKHRHRQ